MPWRELTVVDLRRELIERWKEGDSVTKSAEFFGISRKTAHKWIDRYKRLGDEGLMDLSRAPKSCPHRTAAEIEQILLEARRVHRNWGPRKILRWLLRRNPELVLPAASTVGDLFRREGLVQPRRKARGSDSRLEASTEPTQPNDVWSMDFKGQFRTGDRRYCFPLTVADLHSRFLLLVRGLDSTGTESARRWLEKGFREYGLPRVIRTDNGTPFAVPTARGGLSQFTVWWIRLGIRHERIDRGHPEQNGAHERMHKTLKQETARPPARTHLTQQRRFNAFREEYNFERPHEAIGYRTPADLWTPSPRTYPKRLPQPQYPGHFEIRKVSIGGTFKLGGQKFFVGCALSGEYVGLQEVDDDLWEVYYCDMRLRRFHGHGAADHLR